MASPVTERQPARRTKLRREIVARLWSVNIYDDNKSTENYRSTCQVFVYGDVAMMFSINGSQFYEYMAEPSNVRSLFDELGVRWMEGYVRPSHAKLIKFALRRVADVEELWEGSMAGRRMVWMRVKAK